MQFHTGSARKCERVRKVFKQNIKGASTILDMDTRFAN